MMLELIYRSGFTAADFSVQQAGAPKYRSAVGKLETRTSVSTSGNLATSGNLVLFISGNLKL